MHRCMALALRLHKNLKQAYTTRIHIHSSEHHQYLKFHYNKHPEDFWAGQSLYYNTHTSHYETHNQNHHHRFFHRLCQSVRTQMLDYSSHLYRKPSRRSSLAADSLRLSRNLYLVCCYQHNNTSYLHRQPFLEYNNQKSGQQMFHRLHTLQFLPY